MAATRQQDHATLTVAFRRRAVLAHQSGDAARARSGLQQSYAVATMLGDRRLTAETLNTGARLTEVEVLRELGRLYAETGWAAEGRALS